MRLTSALFVPVLLTLTFLTGCDAFGGDDGSFSATASGDIDYQYEGTAYYRDDTETPTIFLRDGESLAFLIEAPRGFREGTVSVSRSSVVTIKASGLWVDREGVSGEIVIESVGGGEVAGTIDVGLSSYGSDEPYRFLRGTFRGVR